MYSFTPDITQRVLLDDIRGFVAVHLSEPSNESKYYESFDRKKWERSGLLKLPGLAIPEAFGGRGLGALDTLIALEALGHTSRDNGFNFAISAHLLACVVPLWLYGSDDLKKAYLPRLSNGQLIAANAMSEPNAGSDAFKMQTTAILGSQGYEINGTKSFVSNGPVADTLLLYAATDPGRGFMGGISAFWLDRTLHDFSSGPELEKAGLKSSALSSLYFTQTKVDPSFLVGQAGRGAHIFNRSMEWERVCLGGCHMGNLQRLVEKSVGLVRQQYSNGLARESRQAVSHELAEIQSRLEATRLLAYATAWKMDQGKSVGREAAMVKFQISELYKMSTLRISAIFQSAGIFDPDVEQSQMDALSSTIYSGTSEMQKTIIAQSMGL